MRRARRFPLTRAETLAVVVVLTILTFLLSPLLPAPSVWRPVDISGADRGLVMVEFQNFELGRQFETARKEGLLTHELDEQGKPVVKLFYQRGQRRWFGMQYRVIEVTLQRTERGLSREVSEVAWP